MDLQKNKDQVFAAVAEACLLYTSCIYRRRNGRACNPQPSPDSEIYQRRLAGPLYWR